MVAVMTGAGPRMGSHTAAAISMAEEPHRHRTNPADGAR